MNLPRVWLRMETERVAIAALLILFLFVRKGGLAWYDFILPCLITTWPIVVLFVRRDRAEYVDSLRRAPTQRATWILIGLLLTAVEVILISRIYASEWSVSARVAACVIVAGLGTWAVVKIVRSAVSRVTS